ncbi:MAG: 30S ribosomal protein S16 [Patescibacteria group bacterium]
MLVIRLTRVGKKNQPVYRVVLTEKQNPVRGKFNEILGSYNPRLKTKALKTERIKYWLSKGAQASPTVHNLLVSEKIIEAKKVKAWQPKKKTPEAKAAAAKAVAEAEAKKTETPAEEEVKAEEIKQETQAAKQVEEAKASE